MKRSIKSLLLDLATRRNNLSFIPFNKVLLRLMKIGFDPPKREESYPNSRRAACVVSLDFDHMTMSLRSGSTRWFPKPVDELLVKNRNGTSDMLEASEKYAIPMTWAICGRTAEEDPESYESILRSPVRQEIGVHTYSHADIASCTAQEVEDEVLKCLKVLSLRETPRTFVFPWNRTGHFDLLKQMGFLTYRDRNRLVGDPRQHHGLLNIPPTYYVDTNSYRAQSLIKKYVDLCISWNSVFHLWLHPWSVVFSSTDRSGRFVKETLEPVMSYIKQKREEGILATTTMGELGTFFAEESDSSRGGTSQPTVADSA